MNDESDLFEGISDASATMSRCSGRANVKAEFMRRKVGYIFNRFFTSIASGLGLITRWIWTVLSSGVSEPYLVKMNLA